VEAIAVQLRNTLAFLSSTVMSCLDIPHLRPHFDTTPAAVSNINAIASAFDTSTRQLSDFHWDQCGVHAIEVEVVSTYSSRTDSLS